MAYGSKGGVYFYETAEGPRWRYMFAAPTASRQSKRGFTSERAARDAVRRLREHIERGEIRHTSETFGGWWEHWLRRRKPYLEPNARRAYDVDGRIRLLPGVQAVPLARLDLDRVRCWMQEHAEAVEAGELAAKTVNNTLGTVVVCLNSAVKERLIASQPALGIERLPRAHIERQYLRLHEIPFPYRRALTSQLTCYIFECEMQLSDRQSLPSVRRGRTLRHWPGDNQQRVAPDGSAHPL